MSLIHISKNELTKGTLNELSSHESAPDEPQFIIVEGEVRDLPSPSIRLGVDPRLENTVRMINALEEKQKKLFPMLNKIPGKLEKEAEYSNKQLNYLASVQGSSKKYLMILAGAVAVLAAIAGGRLVHMGVSLWKKFRNQKTVSATRNEETMKSKKTGRRMRRLHQRDWRIIDFT